MIAYETFCRLRQLHDQQGLKTAQIAAELDLDPKTVERWIDQPTYQPRQGTRRPSKLEDKRLNSRHHLQKIVALSEIYGPAKVDRALQDALAFEAYGCEYIANILEQRQRPEATPGALHLTRRADLLELELPPADLTPYEPKPHP